MSPVHPGCLRRAIAVTVRWLCRGRTTGCPPRYPWRSGAGRGGAAWPVGHRRGRLAASGMRASTTFPSSVSVAGGLCYILFHFERAFERPAGECPGDLRIRSQRSAEVRRCGCDRVLPPAEPPARAGRAHAGQAPVAGQRQALGRPAPSPSAWTGAPPAMSRPGDRVVRVAPSTADQAERRVWPEASGQRGVGVGRPNQLPRTGMPGTAAGDPSAKGSTRPAPLKRVCQYACRMSSTRTDEPARGAWMNFPSPT